MNSEFVEHENMKLFGFLLRKRRVAIDLAQKACRIAVCCGDKNLASWRTFSRSYLIDIGFTAAESLILLRALQQ